MQKKIARAIAALIPIKSLRRKVRKGLGPKEPSEKIYKSITKIANVKTLHEHVEYYSGVGKILQLLTPYEIVGLSKKRIGGRGDGGYVMLDPGNDGIAYSFGVSNYSPWDLEMASRGLKVYQFDGTIESPPDLHPNMFFHKKNISSTKQADSTSLSVPQIFELLGHKDCNDIILQMDIEGAEWDVLSELSTEQINKFKQIIIEFHHLSAFDDDFQDKLNILEKILHTHKPIHVHMCNWGLPQSLTEHGVFYCTAVYEVTYVRSSDFNLTLSEEHYPTPLDDPCRPTFPEIRIGQWN